MIFSAKKQAEYDEEYAQRNAIHRLDNDEIDYLESLVKKERDNEAIIKSEVAEGLTQFKQKRQAEGNTFSKAAASKKVEAVNAYVPSSAVKRRKKNAGVLAAGAPKSEDSKTKEDEADLGYKLKEKDVKKSTDMKKETQPKTEKESSTVINVTSAGAVHSDEPVPNALGLDYSDSESD